MGRAPLLAGALLGAFMLACDSDCRPAGSCEPRKDGIQGVVATWNLYLGASLDGLISAQSPDEIPGIVEQGMRDMLATDFPMRAQAVARALAVWQPDLVALQEVALWRVQSPGDGGATPATDTLADFLALLTAALDARGLDYRPVVSITNADVELLASSGVDVRLSDREAILARADVPTFEPDSGHYAARITATVGGPGGPTVTVPRGWVSTNAVIGEDTVRVLATHLEVQELAVIQEAQTRELIAHLGGLHGPVVLAGDLNSNADTAGGPSTLTYRLLLDAGFQDAWSFIDGASPGHTCCQAPDLRNPTSTLNQRVDYVLYRGTTLVRSAAVLGATLDERTSSGLWPSDHAGVAVEFGRVTGSN